MQHALFIVQVVIFSFLTVQVAYLLFFSILGRVGKKTTIAPAATLRRIRIFIPGYKEDAVIIETARKALHHDYPTSLFEVVVIADSFTQSTLQALHSLGVKVVEV